jgi:hypothetical protein
MLFFPHSDTHSRSVTTAWRLKHRPANNNESNSAVKKPIFDVGIKFAETTERI